MELPAALIVRRLGRLQMGLAPYPFKVVRTNSTIDNMLSSRIARMVEERRPITLIPDFEVQQPIFARQKVGQRERPGITLIRCQYCDRWVGEYITRMPERGTSHATHHTSRYDVERDRFIFRCICRKGKQRRDVSGERFRSALASNPRMLVLGLTLKTDGAVKRSR